MEWSITAYTNGYSSLETTEFLDAVLAILQISFASMIYPDKFTLAK
jgi:hypothetical protein